MGQLQKLILQTFYLVAAFFLNTSDQDMVPDSLHQFLQEGPKKLVSLGTGL